MQYQRKIINKSDERDIITGMIVSTEFLAGIRPIFRPDLFTLKYARIIAKLCIQYYDEYEIAPSDNIKSLLESNKLMIRGEDDLELIDTFLSSINEKYVDEDINFNVDYEIDKAVKYFKSISLENLTDQIKAAVFSGDFIRAESLIAGFQRIEKGSSSGIDVVRDTGAAVDAVRSDVEDTLFQFPGDLGKLIRPIKRKDFVAIVAPAKRSKSWLLQEMAILAMINRLNILYISLEMPKEQMLVRIYQRLNGELEPSENEYSVEEMVDIPYFDKNYDMNGIINYRKEIKKRISPKSIVRKLESLQLLVKDKKLHLECFPAGSLSVRGGIIPLLDNLEYYEKFIPDAIVLDYADILSPERGGERRHQIDETWQALRGVGQDRSMAIITASHSNKATFDRDIRQSDLSEDNRKLNHVTLAIAINQNEDDEEKGVHRFCVIADRYRRFSRTTEAIVLRCLDIGRPYLDSRLSKK
jgi:hypothetical protein